MGFIKLRDEVWHIVNKSEEVQEEILQAQKKREERIKRVSPIILSIPKYIPLIPRGLIEPTINLFKEGRGELSPERLEFIYKDVQKDICSGGSRQFQFAYRAGHWYGSRPKPDTHIISCTVDFENLSPNDSGQHVTHQESAFIELSIFPSLTGMMFGTLIGGFLGTIASTRNLMSWQWLGILLVNLILSFIAGVLLMRRKDVQSFITIEDLWGGILIGFIVGYAGFQGVLRLFGLSSISSPTNQTASIVSH